MRWIALFLVLLLAGCSSPTPEAQAFLGVTPADEPGTVLSGENMPKVLRQALENMTTEQVSREVNGTEIQQIDLYFKYVKPDNFDDPVYSR